MAAGCVPVVSPLGAHQELITNQTNGFIIEFNDLSTAAENLVRFLNLSFDERKQIVYQQGSEPKNTLGRVLLGEWKGFIKRY